MGTIDAIRAPFYARYNQPMIDPPGIEWFVAADSVTNDILAVAGLGPSLVEGAGGRSLIDILGTNLGALNALTDGIIAYLDKLGLGLSIWMPLDHPSRIKFALDKGFIQTAVLLHRAAQTPAEKAV